MLNACDTVLVITEGVNDAALIAAVLGWRSRYGERKDFRRLVAFLNLCKARGERCIAIWGLGFKPTLDEDRFKRLVGSLRGLLATIETPCVCLVFDSDELDPVEALEKLATLLRCEKRTIHTSSRYYAKCVCSTPSAPEIRIMVWRCTAECWIALLDPNSPITTIDQCDSQTRRECGNHIRRILGARQFEDRVSIVESILNRADAPWKHAIRELGNALRNGQQ